MLVKDQILTLFGLLVAGSTETCVGFAPDVVITVAKFSIFQSIELERRII
jgi:hypothetical protein